jgi:hypothetical protein
MVMVTVVGGSNPFAIDVFHVAHHPPFLSPLMLGYDVSRASLSWFSLMAINQCCYRRAVAITVAAITEEETAVAAASEACPGTHDWSRFASWHPSLFPPWPLPLPFPPGSSRAQEVFLCVSFSRLSPPHIMRLPSWESFCNFTPSHYLFRNVCTRSNPSDHAYPRLFIGQADNVSYLSRTGKLVLEDADMIACR